MRVWEWLALQSCGGHLVQAVKLLPLRNILGQIEEMSGERGIEVADDFSEKSTNGVDIDAEQR